MTQRPRFYSRKAGPYTELWVTFPGGRQFQLGLFETKEDEARQLAAELRAAADRLEGKGEP